MQNNLTLKDAETKIREALHAVTDEDSWPRGEVVIPLGKEVKHEVVRFMESQQESRYGGLKYRYLIVKFELDFFRKENCNGKIGYALACFEDGGKRSQLIPGIQVLNYITPDKIVVGVRDRAEQVATLLKLG